MTFGSRKTNCVHQLEHSVGVKVGEGGSLLKKVLPLEKQQFILEILWIVSPSPVLTEYCSLVFDRNNQYRNKLESCTSHCSDPMPWIPESFLVNPFGLAPWIPVGNSYPR